MFSIKAVSEATGLGVETLRAWERRYGVVVPARDSSGRRSYSADDVIRLRRLREATDRGHPIGRLAGLTDSELGRLLGDSGRDQTAGVLLERILRAVQASRIDECEQALLIAVATLPPRRLMHDVLSPLLQAVGERWRKGELSIAQEHIVTAMVRRHVALLLQTFNSCASRPGIVFATLPGERHELGLLMAATTCASQGYKAHYLGPDLPPKEIASFASSTRSSVVALSIVAVDQLDAVPSMLAEIVDGTAKQAAVWLGGPGARKLDESSLPDSCVIVQDEFELERRLQMLAA